MGGKIIAENGKLMTCLVLGGNAITQCHIGNRIRSYAYCLGSRTRIHRREGPRWRLYAQRDHSTPTLLECQHLDLADTRSASA